MEFLVGFAVFAYSAQETLWPLFEIRSDGLFVGREGFKGLGIVITWPSIRDVSAYGDGLVAIDLVDGSLERLKVGRLAPKDREDLLAAIDRCSVMANKRVQRARPNDAHTAREATST